MIAKQKVSIENQKLPLKSLKGLEESRVLSQNCCLRATIWKLGVGLKMVSKVFG